MNHISVVATDEAVVPRLVADFGDGLLAPGVAQKEAVAGELLLHDLAAALPEREMRIIRMKVDGKRMHEIAKAEHLTFRQINSILLDAYPTIIKTLYG